MYLVSGSLWDWGPLALLWCGADALVWYELLVGTLLGTLVGPSVAWSCPPSIPTWCDTEGDWNSCSLGGKGYWFVRPSETFEFGMVFIQPCNVIGDMQQLSHLLVCHTLCLPYPPACHTLLPATPSCLSCSPACHTSPGCLVTAMHH